MGFLLLTAGGERRFYEEDAGLMGHPGRFSGSSLEKDGAEKGAGDQAGNLSQLLRLFCTSEHREGCTPGLQLEMLKRCFACETQDNGQKEGPE